jgi:plasmid stability protein
MANIYLVNRYRYAFSMTDQSPSRSLDKIIIRLPDGLKERIRRVAVKNDRSVNAELLALLERTYPPESTVDDYIRDIADFVKMAPDDDQASLWRGVFEKLEAVRKETT